MGKKNSATSYLYLIGLALVAIGCFLPLWTAIGGRFNGAPAVSYLNDKGNTVRKIGVILTLAGAIAGIVFCFIKVKSVGLFKLVSLIVSIAGGAYVFFNTSDFGKKFAKGAAKIDLANPSVGFYLILIGWVVALVGWILKRD